MSRSFRQWCPFWDCVITSFINTVLFFFSIKHGMLKSSLKPPVPPINHNEEALPSHWFSSGSAISDGAPLWSRQKKSLVRSLRYSRMAHEGPTACVFLFLEIVFRKRGLQHTVRLSAAAFGRNAEDGSGLLQDATSESHQKHTQSTRERNKHFNI